jgi:hypothetical protein
MRSSVGPIIALLVFSVAAGGCGTMRGKFCMPYTGDDLPPKQAGWEARTVHFHDFNVTVELRNDWQTLQTGWLLGIPIPAWWDLKDRWRYPEDEEGHCIRLTFEPGVDGVLFEPAKVVLEVNGVAHTAHQVQRHFAYQKTATHRASAWDDVLGQVIALETGDSTLYALCFDMVRPAVNEEIRLRLDGAVSHPHGISIPEIRFAVQKYKFVTS